MENPQIYGVADDVVDQIFGVLVRDGSRYALQLHGKPTTTPQQMDYCLKIDPQAGGRCGAAPAGVEGARLRAQGRV